jgi:hypothetical protein
MNVTDFRARVLAAIQAVKRRQPDAYLHLVYAPELADPLGLVNDDRRDTAHLLAMNGTKMTWPREAWPRLITLDCRRIAAYLLENDPALDDPLLEASITQAHAELFLGGGVDVMATNDDPSFAANAVCGWVVTPETALQVASRINQVSTPSRELVFQPGEKYRVDRRWVHWYQPECFSALWPTLAAEERKALLGPALWLTHTETGDLQRFSTDPTDAPAPHENHSALLKLRVVQWEAMDDAPIVKQLTKKWQALCEEQQRPLPKDASAQLHRYVKAARDQHLDGSDLALIVMTAVQLEPGAIETPEFRQMVEQALRNGTSLCDGLANLPESFWERHALAEPQPGIYTSPATDNGLPTQRVQREFRRLWRQAPSSSLFPSPD